MKQGMSDMGVTGVAGVAGVTGVTGLSKTKHAARVACASVLILVALAGSAIPGGCGSPPKAPEPLATTDRTLLPRLHVYPGEPVVVPLERRYSGTGPLVVAEDGTAIPAQLRRILVDVMSPASEGDERSGPDAPDRWMVTPGTWRSVDSASAQTERGRDAIVAAIPVDLDGRLVRVAGRDYVVSVLASSPRLPRVADGSEVDDPWRPILGPGGGGDLALLAQVRIEAQSPLTRWRYRLLVDGLDPAAASGDEEMLDLARFDDPTIEALARQNERRWRDGLARLWGISGDLATRVRHRLSVIADFGNGLRAPAWPTDHGRMDELLESLLDDRLTPARVAQRTEAWLGALPPATAWVVDDAGVAAGDGSTSLPTVGIVNFTDRATLAWAMIEESSGQTPEPKALPARGAAMVVVPSPPRDSSSPEVVAHAGEWSLALSLLPTLRATPPGLTMAPFSPDHTMDVWQRGEMRQSRPEWTTAALLRRAPASSAGPARWEVLLECRRPSATDSRDGNVPRERVEVWFGEPGPMARAVIVHEDGRVERRPMTAAMQEELGGNEPPLPVTRSATGWSVRVPLPPGLPGTAASAGSDAGNEAGTVPAASQRLLRMGAVRIDSAGRRSAWPRPMMPWQEQPGRALIDMGAWEE
jgi:hypothetical protein